MEQAKQEGNENPNAIVECCGEMSTFQDCALCIGFECLLKGTRRLDGRSTNQGMSAGGLNFSVHPDHRSLRPHHPIPESQRLAN